MVQATNAHKPKKGAKRKDRELEEGTVERLAAHGEAFMRMFDDYDDQQQRAQQEELPSVTPEDAVADDGQAKTPSKSDSLQQVLLQPRRSGVSGSSGQPSSSSAQASRRKQQQGPQSGPQPQRDAKAEWKMFMSPKAANVHKSGSAGPGTKPAKEEEDGISKAEFMKMKREVELYGASALEKKEKKAFDARMLKQLGAAAAKAPRVAACIGKGMAKKSKERDAAALEAAIETGMMERKGLGKKRARDKLAAAGGIDRGLNEDQGAYRNGVLRVRKPPSKGGKPKLNKKLFKISL